MYRYNTIQINIKFTNIDLDFRLIKSHVTLHRFAGRRVTAFFSSDVVYIVHGETMWRAAANIIYKRNFASHINIFEFSDSPHSYCIFAGQSKFES